MMMKKTLTVGLGLFAMLAAAPSAMAEGGKISGALTFKGKVPKASKIPISKDNDTCGKGDRIVDEVNVDGKKLLDVAVFIDGEIEGYPPGKFKMKYEMIQKGCRFNPFVSWIPNKEKLKIVNEDPVAHNIHAYEFFGRSRRDLFNFQQPRKGHTKKQKVKLRKSNIVQLQCDIHDFMRGWIIVPSNPFATTASKGTYSLDKVPAGKYTLKAFHPVLGVLDKEVTVKDGETVTVDFEFKK